MSETVDAIIEVESHGETMSFNISFFNEEAPNTVNNFKKLAKDGFYDGLKFHRVIPNFVVQGGCPFSGDPDSEHKAGTGGPGYKIDCETDGNKQHHEKGILSMAHAGRNTGGSQFFICLNRENTSHLDGVHTCFGRITNNSEKLDKIQQGDKIKSIKIIENPSLEK